MSTPLHDFSMKRLHAVPENRQGSVLCTLAPPPARRKGDSAQKAAEKRAPAPMSLEATREGCPPSTSHSFTCSRTTRLLETPPGSGVGCRSWEERAVGREGVYPL